MITIKDIVELVMVSCGIDNKQSLVNSSNRECMDARGLIVLLSDEFSIDAIDIRAELGMSLDQIKYARKRFHSRAEEDEQYLLKSYRLYKSLMKKGVAA